MDYFIENKDIISLAGTVIKFRISEAEIEKEKFWTEIANNGALNTIHEVKTNGPILGGLIVAVWKESNVDPEQVLYFVGTEYDVRNSIYALELKTIPAHKWAIFRCAGEIPEGMIESKKRIFNEVIPSSDLEIIDDFHLEVYSDENKHDEDYRFEIWVPVRE